MSYTTFGRTLLSGCSVFALLAIPASSFAQTPSENILVTGTKSVAEQNLPPTTAASVTATDLQDQVNAVTTEDSLKYLPNIFVRRRHIGDTQAPISTRTSGVGSSARSLIYADGVLLSALIANNNSIGSPRWGMVSPQEIARIDVLYGPFAAAYAGNSIGAVVEIATRMPETFEASLKTGFSLQNFSQYATKDTYPTYQFAATAGDRIEKFAWFLAANHLVSKSQPLAYVTATRPANPSASGTRVTGAFADTNRTGAAIVELGAGGLERQIQDNFRLKLAYDFAPNIRATYAAGVFLHDDKSGIETYLRDGAGAPVYSGSLNIGGYAYNLAASAFSNKVYRQEDEHWMHSLSLGTINGGNWEWQAVATLYRYAKDEQRNPTVALPLGFNSGAGNIAVLNGTGWYTLDAKALWRPYGADGAHQITFGAHGDRYTLANSRYSTNDWISGPKGALATDSRGKTETLALWVQDAWRLTPEVTATLGGRFESWRAYDGFNYSLSPALATTQPSLDATRFSPKASVSWEIDEAWQAKASYGMAYRFPTVSELYQAITTGATLTVPNPELKPERANSGEVSLEYMMANGSVRFTYFEEHLDDALLSQSAPLVPGSTTLFNYVQNIDRMRSRGAEIVVRQDDFLIDGLELQGSAIFVDSTIVKNPILPASVGKKAPQVPEWRATAVATYRPNDALAFTLAARYSDRVYATIDNTDGNTFTYQGFGSYFVVDTRVSYDFDPHWTLSAGIDNLNNRKYFIFHPFPQRSFVAELKYAY